MFRKTGIQISEVMTVADTTTNTSAYAMSRAGNPRDFPAAIISEAIGR